MRKRASQSSARTPAASRRCPPRAGSTTSTRSRVDGTAQITRAATARYENTSTRAVSWIERWNRTATHTAASRVTRHHSPIARKTSVSTITLAAYVWNDRSVSTSIAQAGRGEATSSSRTRTVRCQVTVPPNQSGSTSFESPDAP